MITLATNKGGASFTIVGGADDSRFTVKGNELTFKATDFEARSDATYRVNIKATKGNETTKKILAVTVTNVDEAPTGVSISGMVDGVDVDSPLGYDGGKVGVNKRVTLFANGIDVDSPLVYEWIVPTGIITDVTNRDTKSIRFTTTEAMEGRTYVLSVLVNGVLATTTVEVNNVDDDVVPVKELVIITADVFYTPENTDKVITLATNKGGASFTILDDADASKFTLEEGNKLTFKATAFKARSDATYRVNIKATKGNEATKKTLAVTVVAKNLDDYGVLRITTADVSTPENTDKVITLITNKSDTNVFKNMVTQFSIVGGADAKRFTLKKGNKLTFKATAFKAQSNTYHVKIKVFQELFDRDFIAWPTPPLPETAYKTLTVILIMLRSKSFRSSSTGISSHGLPLPFPRRLTKPLL
ncbi:hypothetical protein [uncultured Gammaproteobacteria bacterium]|nr:hypothetical protein [uncultured Gammaproteobacteria bacterium]